MKQHFWAGEKPKMENPPLLKKKSNLSYTDLHILVSTLHWLIIKKMLLYMYIYIRLDAVCSSVY